MVKTYNSLLFLFFAITTVLLSLLLAALSTSCPFASLRRRKEPSALSTEEDESNTLFFQHHLQQQPFLPENLLLNFTKLLQDIKQLNEDAKTGYTTFKSITNGRFASQQFQKPLIIVKPSELILLKNGKSYSEKFIGIEYTIEKATSHLVLGLFGLTKLFSLYAATATASTTTSASSEATFAVDELAKTMQPSGWPNNSSKILSSSFVLDSNVQFEENGEWKNLTRSYFDTTFQKYLSFIDAFAAESANWLSVSSGKIKLLLDTKVSSDSLRKEYMQELLRLDGIKTSDAEYFVKLRELVKSFLQTSTANATCDAFQTEVVERWSFIVPHIYAHINRATFLTVYAMDEIIHEKWKNYITKEELLQDSLVVMTGPHMPRDNYLYMTYFQELLEVREEGGRIIFVEDQYAESQYYNAAAIHLIDNSMSEDVFGIPKFMHSDLLSVQGSKIVTELFQMKRNTTSTGQQQQGLDVMEAFAKTKRFTLLELLVYGFLVCLLSVLVSSFVTAKIITSVHKRKLRSERFTRLQKENETAVELQTVQS